MSDVDIGIITNVDLPLIEIGLLISQLETQLKGTVDLLVLNDLYKKNPQLAFNIIVSYRVVFCRSDSVLIEFKRNTLLYYFDTEPLRKMADEAFWKRLGSGKFGMKNYVG